MKAKYINENNIEFAPPYIIDGEKIVQKWSDNIKIEEAEYE